MKKWKQFIVVFALLVGVGVAATPAPQAAAIDVFSQCGGSGDTSVCGAKGDSASGMIKTVVSVLMYVLGVISVIMIIVGGIRYSTSGGNSSSIKEAKDTIIYAVVGLVIAIMAFAIVNFVLGKF